MLSWKKKQRSQEGWYGTQKAKRLRGEAEMWTKWYSAQHKMATKASNQTTMGWLKGKQGATASLLASYRRAVGGLRTSSCGLHHKPLPCIIVWWQICPAAKTTQPWAHLSLSLSRSLDFLLYSAIWRKICACLKIHIALPMEELNELCCVACNKCCSCHNPIRTHVMGVKSLRYITLQHQFIQPHYPLKLRTNIRFLDRRCNSYYR